MVLAAENNNRLHNDPMDKWFVSIDLAGYGFDYNVYEIPECHLKRAESHY